MRSSEAAPLFNDGSLDFVYIDANHSYESIKEDLGLWYPKMKTHSIFAGHDFSTQHESVIKAVSEFQCPYELNILYGDKNESWYYIIK